MFKNLTKFNFSSQYKNNSLTIIKCNDCKSLPHFYITQMNFLFFLLEEKKMFLSSIRLKKVVG